jgi:hypothetical protein
MNGTFGEGVLTGDADLPDVREMTFYTLHGELFAQACAVMTILIALALTPRLLRSG